MAGVELALWAISENEAVFPLYHLYRLPVSRSPQILTITEFAKTVVFKKLHLKCAPRIPIDVNVTGIG